MRTTEQEPLFYMDGTSTDTINNNDGTFAIWRVLTVRHDRLICAFYGGASYAAASMFCEYINANEDYRKHAQ